MVLQDSRWRRAAIAALFLGILGVGGYLGTPNADSGVAVGMALAYGAVLAALGILYWISHRASRKNHL